jgi:osmoprotectant transport system permease protein
VSTTTIASLAGYSGTLGEIIANETSYHLPGVLGAAICIAVLALVVDAVLGGIQWALTPRAMRHSQADTASLITPTVQEAA